METKDCSFSNVCTIFKKEACRADSLGKKECEKPHIDHEIIILVADISGSSHKIAIIAKCPKCEKITGYVTGDSQPIPYTPGFIILTPEEKVKIPLFLCAQCLGSNKFVFPQANEQRISA